MFAMLSVALSLNADQQGSAIVREIVCRPRKPVTTALLNKFAGSHSNGDGTWTMTLRPGVGLSHGLAKLKDVALETKVLKPRLVGQPVSLSELKLLEASMAVAATEFKALPDRWKATASNREPEDTFELAEERLESRPAAPAEPRANTLYASALSAVNPPAQVWTNIGPRNLQTYGTYGNGAPPINGRINDVAYDFSDPAVMYAASARGGVWKSSNSGQDWAPLSETWPALNTSVVETNPGLKDHVYVGTGDEPANYGTSIGLMVSTNQGASFTARGVAEFSSYQISDVSVVPDQPKTLIVASGGGTGTRVNQLYRTTDEGVTWAVVIPQPTYWTDLDVSIPASSCARRYYAAGHRQGDNCVLYRSDDRGQTWNWVSLPVATTSDRIYIACSKLSADVVYVHFTDQRRVFKNSGAGGSWLEITNNLGTISDGEWGQSNYNNGLTCFLRQHPFVSFDALFLQNVDTYVTSGPDSNGFAGGAWADFAYGYSGTDKTHVDHHNIAVNPSNANEFLFANDGGVAKCKYDPLANSGDFESLSRNLVAALVSRISIDPTNINGVLAGMQDNGMASCAGDPDNWLNLLAGDLGHSSINQSLPGFQYLMPPSFKGGLVETQDGWATREYREVDTSGDKMRSSPPVVHDPTHPQFVYVATNYLYRYDALNKSWATRIGNQLLDASEHVRHLAVAPSNSLRIYTVSASGDVWMTKDGGTTWAEISTGGSSLPNLKLSHISVDPVNENRILVGVEDATSNFFLYRCLNTDAVVRTWTSVHGVIAGKSLPKLPVLAIQRHPAAPSTCWIVGGDFGVWMTFDAGKTWRDLGANNALPRVAVTDIKIQQQDFLFAATYGRGVWRTPLPKAPVGVGF